MCVVPYADAKTTGHPAIATALNNANANLFSDLMVHHMGSGLADGVGQGNAGPDEFRSAPLWGLGQRVFFLHDGRTSDLLQAIQAHASSGSEANQVINNFNALTESQKAGSAELPAIALSSTREKTGMQKTRWACMPVNSEPR